jgi:hypothetical protein
LVYIREAHPTDGWQVAANEKDKILLTAPKTVGQKQEYASACVRNLGIKFRSAVDGMDHLVESDYSGWPDRLYLIGKDGRVAWKGRPGPQGFRPQELEAAVRKELGT